MANFQQLLMLSGEAAHDTFGSGMPTRLDIGGLFLCTDGSGDVVIDMKQYPIKKGDLIVAFPYTIVQLLRHDTNFDGYIVGVDLNFFGMIQIPDKSSYYLYIKENPCISLEEDEQSSILQLHNMLVKEKNRTDHPLKNEIEECLLKMLAYEIAGTYLKRKPITQQVCSRNDEIFQQFIYSLFINVRFRYPVSHYASEQSITPRHLSMVVKEVSGQTAGDWVRDCTIMNIKLLLQDFSLSINQVSDSFHFPNPSFFSQYFKKYTGVTPKEYRNSKC